VKKKIKKKKTKTTKNNWVFKCFLYDKWKWNVREKISREKFYLMCNVYYIRVDEYHMFVIKVREKRHHRNFCIVKLYTTLFF
jgi:hypothetical protein